MVSKTTLLTVVLASLAQPGFATTCQDIFISVPVGFPYISLPGNLTAQNITSDYAAAVLNMTTVRGTATYQIGATFCEPTVNNASRQNTIQILQHGIEYNRTYFTALGLTQYPQNNYVEFASNEGYPTLSIDRLCNGLSSHPNGLLNCQNFAQAEVLHQIVLKARAGTLPLGSSTRAFTTVIGAGHSLGASIIKIGLSAYPNDFDGVILSGFSTRFTFGFAGLVLYGGLTPADLYMPKFASLDPTYIAITKESGYDYINYFGDYEQVIATADFVGAGTVTLGEALTAPFSQLPTPAYKNAIFLADGKRDPFYCQTGPTTVLNMANRGDCSVNVPTEVRKSFPNVPSSKYGYYVADNTGHVVHLHRTAPDTFSAIFSFLDAQGF